MKEEVVVVVIGLVAELIVIGMFVPAATAMALIFTRIEVALISEQVELIVLEQVVVPFVRATSLGTVTIMLDPVTKALIVVKERVMSETTPMETFDIEAELVVIVETVDEIVVLPESIE